MKKSHVSVIGLLTIGIISILVTPTIIAEEEFQVIASIQSVEPYNNGLFSYTLEFEGDLMVMGEPQFGLDGISQAGQVHVYDSEGAFRYALTSPEPTSLGKFGNSIATDGSLIVVGETGADHEKKNEGKAYIFNSECGLVATLLAPVPTGNKGYGTAVEIAGDYVLVSEIYTMVNDVYYAGIVYIYDNNGEFVTTLQSPEPLINSNFGSKIAAGSDVVAIAEMTTPVGGEPTGPGKVYVFDLEWNLISTLSSPDTESNKDFGCSIAVSGDHIVVGESIKKVDGKERAGSAYLFTVEGELLQTYKAPVPEEGGRFGGSVAIRDDLILIGEWEADVEDADEGRAYLYDTDGQLLQSLESTEVQVNSEFGHAVAISGETLVINQVCATVDGVSRAGKAYLYGLGSEAAEPTNTGSESTSTVTETQEEIGQEAKTGVPGFPWRSILIGLVVVTILLWRVRG